MDTEVLSGQLFDAVAIGDWWAAAAFGVTLATWAILKWARGATPSRLTAFLLDPVVSFLLPVVLAAGPGVVAAVMSGTPFTLGLLIGAVVKVAGGSKLMFLGLKNALERRALPKVPPAAALVLLLPLLSLQGCSSVTPFIVTGEAIDAAGQQFVAAAPVFYEKCEKRELSYETCLAWADFAHRFKHLYRPSVDAWVAAVEVNEAAVSQRYGDMLAPLLAELASFYGALKQAKLLPAGAP